MTEFEFDPFDYEQDLDPYPIYRRMRDEAPCYHNERLDFWALTRYRDCLDAFIDWETYSSARGTVLEMMDAPSLPPLMIFLDPPRQTRLRNLVNRAFTPRRIVDLEPEIRKIACQHLDALVGLPRFDVVKEFTAKLPMDVISALLGIPPEDRDRVRGWSNDILHRDPGTGEMPARSLEAQVNLLQYFSGCIEERQKRPREDMMTALIDATIQGADGKPEALTPDEITGFINLLATAGNETVTKLLATAFYWLNRFPEQRAILMREPEVIPNAVEETLRFDPPSQYQGRTLTRDVELHGRLMPEGAKVMLINGASGRDEREFPDPDRYDVRREIEMHLGFGYGRHLCLGINLARMEMRVALQEFFQRFGEYGVPEDGLERMHSSNVRGYSGMILEV